MRRTELLAKPAGDGRYSLQGPFGSLIRSPRGKQGGNVIERQPKRRRLAFPSSHLFRFARTFVRAPRARLRSGAEAALRLGARSANTTSKAGRLPRHFHRG